MQTIYFEDHQQDFLAWDIKDGEVVDCRPCQGDVWIGMRVLNTDIRRGDILNIMVSPGRVRSIKYPVEKVINHG